MQTNSKAQLDNNGQTGSKAQMDQSRQADGKEPTGQSGQADVNGRPEIQKAIKIHEKDNVAVALTPLSAGDTVETGGILTKLAEDIPQGHKFMLKDIQKGEDILKYGFPIGSAQEEVSAGRWIHVHNIKTNLGEVLDYEYTPEETKTVEETGDVAQRCVAKQGEAESTGQTDLSGHKSKEMQAAAKIKATFHGYKRKTGKAGIRNEVWIVPTVGCVNSIATALAGRASEYGAGKVDGVYAFPHPYGCSQMGGDQVNTLKSLAGLIRHPNAGAVLVLGLGCENCGFELVKEVLGDYDPQRVAFLECQSVADEMEAGEGILKTLIDEAGKTGRSEIDASELVIGLKCGGSDGLSGITANPLVGSFSDKLIAAGGSTILTEVPEMFGAETILMNRCKDKETFEKMVTLINDFKDYFIRHDQVIYENPSPGNKKGGISTLEDKSLGCTQKGGTASVVDVLQYGEMVREKGLNLLSAPGNDLVASTALALSGAHIVLFTTGRGTPFGSPVPTVKISSNSKLAKQKSGWIDFNAGTLVEGKEMEEVSEAFFQYILDIASGKETKTEINGFRDLAIFKSGVTL